MRQQNLKWIKRGVIILLSAVGFTGAVSAGGFLTGARISYPSGYTGNGGTLDINVCIAPGTTDAAQMSNPLRNAIAQWNRLQPASSNIRNFFLSSGKIDFESVALHELGHCIGLSHPSFGQPGFKCRSWFHHLICRSRQRV